MTSSREQQECIIMLSFLLGWNNTNNNHTTIIDKTKKKKKLTTTATTAATTTTTTIAGTNKLLSNYHHPNHHRYQQQKQQKQQQKHRLSLSSSSICCSCWIRSIMKYIVVHSTILTMIIAIVTTIVTFVSLLTQVHTSSSTISSSSSSSTSTASFLSSSSSSFGFVSKGTSYEFLPETDRIISLSNNDVNHNNNNDKEKSSSSSSSYQTNNENQAIQQQQPPKPQQLQQQQQQPPKLLSSSSSVYIPDQFRSVDTIVLQSTIQQLSFPRWSGSDGVNSSSNTNSNNRTIIDSMIDFITKQTNHYDTCKGITENPPGLTSYCKNTLVHTSDHNLTTIPNYWFPETLYILQKNCTLTGSSTSRLLSNDNNTTGAIKFKLLPTEKMMKNACQILQNQIQQQQQGTKWPNLQKLLFQPPGQVQTNNNNNHGLPFLAHYSDYTGCNYMNWNQETESIPLFTVAASVNCNYTFPLPNYRVIGKSYHSIKQYNKILNQQQQYYPTWDNKIPQVIWRGTLTGQLPTITTSDTTSDSDNNASSRYELLKLVHSQTQLTEQQRNLFNIKLTRIPIMNQKLLQSYLQEQQQEQSKRRDENNSNNNDQQQQEYDIHYILGNVTMDNSIKMIDFQNYRAILDIDGHSWSSRYCELLCYNSVVLKVDPTYVDYFYYPSKNRQGTNNDNNSASTTDTKDDEHRQLVPWKHYIPVLANLSDLVEKAAYAVATENQHHIEQIITNANAWCKTHMIQSSIYEDVLDVWESYISILNTNDPNWSTKWNTFYNVFVQSSSQKIMQL